MKIAHKKQPQLQGFKNSIRFAGSAEKMQPKDGEGEEIAFFCNLKQIKFITPDATALLAIFRCGQMRWAYEMSPLKRGDGGWMKLV